MGIFSGSYLACTAMMVVGYLVIYFCSEWVTQKCRWNIALMMLLLTVSHGIYIWLNARQIETFRKLVSRNIKHKHIVDLMRWGGVIRGGVW